MVKDCPKDPCVGSIGVERFMLPEHFTPDWSCITPMCKYHRDQRDNENYEIQRIIMAQEDGKEYPEDNDYISKFSNLNGSDVPSMLGSHSLIVLH